MRKLTKQEIKALKEYGHTLIEQEREYITTHNTLRELPTGERFKRKMDLYKISEIEQNGWKVK
jgi:hypothetical protein